MTNTSSPPRGPLPLAPLCLDKVWASPTLAAPWDGLWPAPPNTGEIWLASDRLHVTPVAAGPLAGQGLDQVLARWPQWFLGQDRGDSLPILLKILNVGQWLSVQVHPGDEAARRLENEPWGKSESWHVLGAAPGAEIIMGLKLGVDQAQMARATAQGGLPALLARVPAKAGDTFHLPAGTVHATGPGLVICELQQASDVTYRFYDWDRPGSDGKLRPLHQDKALAVMTLAGPGAPQAPRLLEDGPNRLELLVEDPHFALLGAQVREPYQPHWGGRRLRLVTVLAGQGRWQGAQAPNLAPGQTWLLPAGQEGLTLLPAPGGLTLLESLA
ncbi:MAG: class I mannose-6-phosphate isomerase [Desulfarculus sp.]|nr:class I mannose-6-phosphate isomerase [Desulfarculus sp.]